MKTKKISPMLPTLLIAMALTAVLRSIAVCRDLDFKYGYFNSDTLISISGWLVFAAIIVLSVITLLEGKRENLLPTYHSPATYLPAALVCTALPFVAKELLVRFTDYTEQATKGQSRLCAVISLLCCVLCVCSVACFFLFTFIKAPFDGKRAVAITVIAFSLIIYAVYLYFTTDLPLNSPNKIVDQTAYVFAAVFFLYEARATLGKAMWRTYAIFGQIAALLCAYSSIPALAVFFIKGKTISNSIYESILTFTLFIFISARLILFTEFESTDDCETVKAIKMKKAQQLGSTTDKVKEIEETAE